jgi:mono/diheme cytochrome c family protein
MEESSVILRALAISGMALMIGVVGCSPGGGGGGPGDATRGRQLFESKQCITCHTLSSVPTAQGSIGPTLNGIANTGALRKPPMSAEAYIRESIKDSAAFVVPGYTAPTAGGMLLPIPVNDQEISDLVAFLLTEK